MGLQKAKFKWKWNTNKPSDDFPLPLSRLFCRFEINYTCTIPSKRNFRWNQIQIIGEVSMPKMNLWLKI